MYMAIFSGGKRYIRAELSKADPPFFASHASSAGDHPGRSFLYFDGEEDGEDVKAAFKANLVQAETLFTPAQRTEIVQEAMEIFRYSIMLVEELDETMGTPTQLLKRIDREVDANEVQGSIEEAVVEPAHLPRAQAVAAEGPRPTLLWLNGSALSGLAVLVGCACWYALHHSSSWLFYLPR